MVIFKNKLKAIWLLLIGIVTLITAIIYLNYYLVKRSLDRKKHDYGDMNRYTTEGWENLYRSTPANRTPGDNHEISRQNIDNQ